MSKNLAEFEFSYLDSNEAKEHLLAQELSDFLDVVYVGGGFTDKDVAKQVFAPEKVIARGSFLIARTRSTGALAAMVILVPGKSRIATLAGEQECEVHLLGVLPEHRGKGLGELLMNNLIVEANKQQFHNIFLWTQPTMVSAQQIYSALGFIRMPQLDFVKVDRNFMVYSKALYRP